MVINAIQNRLWRMAVAATILVVLGIGIAQVAIAQAVCDSALADAVDRVENAPYSAQRRVTTIHQNGSSSRDEATQSEHEMGKDELTMLGNATGPRWLETSEFRKAKFSFVLSIQLPTPTLRGVQARKK